MGLFLDCLLYSLGPFFYLRASSAWFYIQVDHILTSSFTDEETECLFPNEAVAEPELGTGFLDLKHDSFLSVLCCSHLSPPLSLVRV